MTEAQPSPPLRHKKTFLSSPSPRFASRPDAFASQQHSFEDINNYQAPSSPGQTPDPVVPSSFSTRASSILKDLKSKRKKSQDSEDSLEKARSAFHHKLVVERARWDSFLRGSPSDASLKADDGSKLSSPPNPDHKATGRSAREMQDDKLNSLRTHTPVPASRRTKSPAPLKLAPTLPSTMQATQVRSFNEAMNGFKRSPSNPDMSMNVLCAGHTPARKPRVSEGLTGKFNVSIIPPVSRSVNPENINRMFSHQFQSISLQPNSSKAVKVASHSVTILCLLTRFDSF